MAVPRNQLVALAVASAASVALTIGGVAFLAGTRSAEASTGTPEASISSGSTTVVPVLPGEVEAAEPEDHAEPNAEAAEPKAEAAEPKAEATAVPTGAEALPLGPIDTAAIVAGFREGGYRFTVRPIGFASFAAATPLETGDVQDAEHYALEWPDSTFISRYVRDGDSRTAWVGASVLDLVPGDGWERTPDEMLPLDFFVAAIDPWMSALPGGSADGTYAAGTAVLTSQAQALGVSAADWALSVTVDGRGRLTSATFEGLVRGRPFLMDIEVRYRDMTGAGIPTPEPVDPGAPPVETGPDAEPVDAGR